MAIKTFINGQENGVITFKGDTEPCSLYVNGEKQDNLSYYGVDVTGENSVTYESEYKKNIRTMKADGNTFQQTYEGYQLLELRDSSGSKTDSDGNVLSWEVKDGIVTVNGMSNTFVLLSLDYRNYNNITYKAGTYTYTPYYYRELGDIGMTGCDWKFRDVYYDTDLIGFTSNSKGIAIKTFEHDFKIVHIQLYINSNVQYDNFKYTPAILKGEYATLADLPPYEPYVGGIPSPNAGQTYEVQNKVESLNAKDYTYYSSDDYIFVTQEPIALTSGISYEIDAQYAGAGTPPSDFTLGVAQTREDFFASQGNPLNVTWLITNGTPTGNKPVLEAPFYIGVGSTNTPVTDKDVYINALYDYFIVFFNSYSKVTIPAYPQPIENANDNGMSLVNNGLNFNSTIPIPASVTKADGTVVQLPMRRVPKMYDNSSATEGIDYLKVDRVANKVEYVRGTSALTFDNTWGFISRGNNIFQLQARLSNTVNFGTSVYCNKYKTYIGVGQLANVDYGLTLDGRYYGQPQSTITVKDIRFDNATDFNNSLTDLPIEVVFCLVEPVITDITDTDLGQALLNLATQNRQNTITITSEPSISALNVNYAKWGGIPSANYNS